MEYDSRYKKKNLLSALMELGVLSILRNPMVSTLLLFLAGALFAAVIIVSYPDSMNNGGKLPVVEADMVNIKSVPKDRGGIEIIGRDSTIFEAMRGDSKHDRQIENLLAQQPDEEALIDISESVNSSVLIKDDQVFDAIEENEKDLQSKAVVSNEKDVKEESTALLPSKIKSQATKSEDIKQPETTKYVGSVLSNEKPKLEPGNYYVQLASLKSEADAERQWVVVQKQYSELSGVGHRVSRADLGAKGVYYRLQAGGMSKSSAEVLCKVVRAKSEGCFVVQ